MKPTNVSEPASVNKAVHVNLEREMVMRSLPVSGGDVDGVHHGFNGLTDLPRSNCVLLKLGLHCRLRDELL